MKLTLRVIVSCRVISQNIQIKGKYTNLLDSKLNIDLVKTVVNIEKFRKQYIEMKAVHGMKNNNEV